MDVPRHASWPCAAAVLIAARGAFAATGGEVCGGPPPDSRLSAALLNHGDAGLEPPPGTTHRQYRSFEAAFVSGARAFSWGFAHRYVMFDFDGIDPQTNAHLHTSWFPLHWSRADDSLRISVAPALAASSNVMGHPRKYRGDTLQLLAAVAWRRPISAALTLRYGLCGDHRFGEYAVYPAVGLEWRAGTDWRLELGFPDVRLHYRIDDRWTSELSIAPGGNQWHVMDRGFERQSSFVYEAWSVDWRVAREVLPGLTLSAGAGTDLDPRYEFTLSNGDRAHRSTDPVLSVGAELSWRF